MLLEVTRQARHTGFSPPVVLPAHTYQTSQEDPASFIHDLTGTPRPLLTRYVSELAETGRTVLRDGTTVRTI